MSNDVNFKNFIESEDNRLKKLLGENIKKARKLRGITQDELAQKLGLKRSVISKYENGLIEPSVFTVQKIAEILDISTFDIIFQVDSERKHLESDIKFTQSLLAIEPSAKSTPIDSAMDRGTAELFGVTDETTMDEFIGLYLDSPVYIDFESLEERERFEKIAFAFKKLNNQGQNKSVERVEELTRLPENQKDKTPSEGE